MGGLVLGVRHGSLEYYQAVLSPAPDFVQSRGSVASCLE